MPAPEQISGQVSEQTVQAAEALAPEVGLFGESDPVLFGRALAAAAVAGIQRPTHAAQLGAAAALDIYRAWAAAGLRAMGRQAAPPIPYDPKKDRRFADPAWEENPFFFGLRETYLAGVRLFDALVESAELEPMLARKAAFAARLFSDTVAPTNFLLSNPAALKRAFETGGQSVVAGTRAMVDDILHNHGRPRQVDARPFKLGENLAATPGKVIFRNDMMELMQYLPQTDEVYERPLLMSPPWINKYYVMDLSPGRSFIEWAVQHGHTVFAISYRNPDASMANVRMDDYLINGPTAALGVIEDITGADKIDIVGLCLGGTLTAMTDTYLNEIGDHRLGSITLLNTLLDFTDPGPLGTFTDRETVAGLEKKMARKGYLEGPDLAQTFDLLRANDLIFNYVVSNWLMGKQPPAFDILAWNADSTRMPAAMHSFYMRTCYLENQLAEGRMELAGQRLTLKDVDADMYVVSAENDHIVLWPAAYKTTQLVSGPARFVLSSGGHIAGIVNPPTPKGWYLTSDNPDNPPDAQEWRAGAKKHSGGSWWEDWAVWAGERAGAKRQPPRIGSRKHRVLGDGPGEYVRGK